MKGTHTYWPVLAALAALTCSGGHLSAGDLYSLVLASDGVVWGWGWNESGQLGVPMVPFSAVPVLINP